ncbi:MAG: helix-turn-helix transcriptional regulator [Planctomycetes bacterium]|nr:helix-turn-helix transcriptional regulator [Planctomycetota bacterium]
MDAVFVALASPVRRRILDILKARPGCTVNDVCAYFEMTRIGVMKHLQILNDAMLVTSRKEGRSRHLFHNAVPIRMIYDRWTTEYSEVWAQRLTEIKYKVEKGGTPPRPGKLSRRRRTKRRRIESHSGADSNVDMTRKKEQV